MFPTPFPLHTTIEERQYTRIVEWQSPIEEGKIGHLQSAEPVAWAESRVCTAKFPDWYQHDLPPTQLDQLTSYGL